MMQTLDLRDTQHSRAELSRLAPRARIDVSTASVAAAELIADVRARGVDALLDQAQRFDGVRPAQIRVHSAEIADAISHLDPVVRGALEEAIDRVSKATQAQVPEPMVTKLATGAEIIQRWQPITRVGFYVPGGKAVYPSSVVMSVVPAHVAGVGSVAIASPPQKDFGG